MMADCTAISGLAGRSVVEQEVAKVVCPFMSSSSEKANNRRYPYPPSERGPKYRGNKLPLGKLPLFPLQKHTHRSGNSSEILNRTRLRVLLEGRRRWMGALQQAPARACVSLFVREQIHR